MSPITLLISVLVAAFGAVDPSNRCDQIPLTPLNFEDWIRLSPYYFVRSNGPEYHCSSVALIGPAGTAPDYSGTGVVIKGNSTITFDLTMINDTTIAEARQCSDGVSGGYRVMFSNLYSRSNASVCVFICDSDGVKISKINCLGRTPADEAYVTAYVDSLDVEIDGTFYYSQSGCPTPTHCAVFT